MNPVRLAVWEKDDGLRRSRELAALGYDVAFDPVDAGTLLRSLQEESPAAMVIDLSRSPSQGRDLALALRIRKSTRNCPLVLIGGTPSTEKKLRQLLPDAEYASWEEVGEALERAITSPPSDPVVPDSPMAGYSGTPLTKKLGIKPGVRILLARPPGGFPETLGPLPEGVTIAERYSASVGLILWFVRSRRELRSGIRKWSSRISSEGIWILWPKQSSGMDTDLKQAIVRKTGLDAGLVDYKIAAVDSTWSGLKFARRR